jgi:hypothetical protein
MYIYICLHINVYRTVRRSAPRIFDNDDSKKEERKNIYINIYVYVYIYIYIYIYIVGLYEGPQLGTSTMMTHKRKRGRIYI